MASSTAFQLPEDFLSKPAPDVRKNVIDFRKEGLAVYEDAWAVVLDHVLSEQECATLLAATEATSNGKWERALVNIGGGQQRMYDDIRRCGRIIVDDTTLAAKIWNRVEPHVQEIIQLQNKASITGNGPAKRRETWIVTRLNERLRFLKYTGGEYFKGQSTICLPLDLAEMAIEHCDGSYETPNMKERSYVTLQLYLNSAADQLKGGATTFHGMNMQDSLDVEPAAGRVLLFQHRNLLHSGADVIKGTKYTMRTDVMYTRK